MNKIKFFFIRNYQRFIRFLISFSAIDCILVSSFAVGAVTSFTPKVGAPTYLSVDTFNGETLVFTTEVPNGAIFGVRPEGSGFLSYTNLPEPYPVITSLVQRVPFSFSVPSDSYFQSDFIFMATVGFVGLSSISDFDDISFSLHCSDGSVVPLSWQYRFVEHSMLDVSIPLTKTAEYIEISFKYSPPVSASSAPLRFLKSSFTFKNSVYGSAQEFAGSNIFAFLDVIGSFFSCAVSFLSSCLAIIVASPALTILCLAMPICGFSVLLLRRFIRT